MGKKRTFDSNDLSGLVEEPKEVTKEVPAPTPLVRAKAPSKPKAKVEVKSAVQAISFDRWFATTGKPPHHKVGMRAYKKTSGRRTKPVWDVLFKDY